MEYSLKDIKRVTKEALLKEPEVLEIYQTIYENIRTAAEQGKVEWTTVLHSLDKLSQYENTLKILQLDGFNVEKKLFTDCILIYISWIGEYETNN